MTIHVSIEHYDSKRALQAEEQKNGKINKYEISIKSDVNYPGFAGRPPGIIEALKVSYQGQEGYLFSNEMDNHFRSDFVTADELSGNPKFIESITPQADQLAIKEQAKKDAQARALKQKIAYEESRKADAQVEFNARQEVNSLLVGFFNDNDLEAFVAEDMKRTTPSKDGQRILSTINRHIEKTGQLPLITLPDTESNSSKEKELLNQLFDDGFLSKYGVTIDLKIDKNHNLMLKLLDKENNPVSIFKTEILEEEGNIHYTVGDFDEHVEEEAMIYDVDVYNSTISENGKKMIQMDSVFGNFYEELFVDQYFTAEENVFASNITNDDNIDTYPLEDLTARNLMHAINHNNELSTMLHQSIEKSKQFTYKRNSEKSNETELAS